MYSATLDYSGGGLEQMIVGGSSPGSPNNPSVPAQYLPGFLMNDMGTPTATPNPRAWSMPGTPSPTRVIRPHFSAATSTSPRSLLSPVQVSSPHPNTSQNFQRNFHRQASEKHSGPPIHGLFEYTSSPGMSVKNVATSTPIPGSISTLSYNPAPLTSDSFLSPQVGGRNAAHDFKFPSSPAQIDPFYTQREELKFDEELDKCWVTVFGFPSAASSFMLQQFYHYGNITEYKMSPSGNWMHLHYQTELQAKVALSKNGKIFNGSIMVGVAPCIDKAVMNLGQNTSRMAAQKHDQTNTSLLNASLPINNSTPINVAIKHAANDYAVIPSGTVPEKSGGLMSKALEYLFGW